MMMRFLRILRPARDSKLDPEKDDFKILLVKQSERLGNVVLLNSIIDGLSRLFPKAEIDLLLPDAFSDVMRDDKRVSRVLTVRKRAYIMMPWKLVSLIIDLRKTGYDLAIDCSDVNSHSITEAAYTLMSGAKTTAGWRRDSGRIFDIEVPRYDDTVHASEMYLRLASGVFDTRIDGSPYFGGAPQTRRMKEPVVGINCGGRESKRWPMENFVEVGNMLSAEGVRTEYILGPDEERLRPDLARQIPADGRLVPPTPAGELKKLISGYSLFVSSDTGPMHLAWALGVPTLAIFIDSEIEKFEPLSPGSIGLDGSRNLTAKSVFDIAVRIIETLRISV